MKMWFVPSIKNLNTEKNVENDSESMKVKLPTLFSGHREVSLTIMDTRNQSYA